MAGAVQVVQTMLAVLFVALAGMGVAGAGTLTRADLEQLYPAPLAVGERNAGLPVWPVFSKAEAKPELRGYAWETVDFEPVRGYSSKPINLLVEIDATGKFLGSHLVSHMEPLFRGARGDALLQKFSDQYPGLTTGHDIQVASWRSQFTTNGKFASLQGIAAGTVTARAIDRSIVDSAITVANAVAAGELSQKPGAARRSSRVERDVKLAWDDLLARNLVQTTRFTRAQIEEPFKGTRSEGRDERAAIAPHETAVEFRVSLASIPLVGRNLLAPEGWQQLRTNLRGASHALLVTETGPLAAERYESRRMVDPTPFRLRQDGRELRLRTMAYDHPLAYPEAEKPVRMHVLLVDKSTPLDPAQPFEFDFHLTRKYGEHPFHRAHGEYPVAFRLPDAQAWFAASYEPAWAETWRARAWEVGVLVAGLLVLAVALARQRWIAATPARLRAFRLAYLVFTLGFVGWYAQGQLTIVNLTASIEALAAGGDLSFLMSDPMTVVLWAFVLVTVFVWGRGTFCGWLCPFGALQELVSTLTQKLGWRPRRMPLALDARLKWIKYAVLAGILGAVAIAPASVEYAVEVEPFKTAISTWFQRDWPYVAWAIACIAASVFVYRGYCRYLCPLGAALAVTDRLRLLRWIPRRVECGTPCQTCRHRCHYQSIAPAGRVQYSECFQCLDCVSIHEDATRCLPLVQQRRPARRVIPVRLAEAT